MLQQFQNTSLPEVSEFDPEKAFKNATKENQPKDRPRILLAEDDSDLRSLMRAFLQHEGYDVLVCADGQRALDLCQDGTEFDLLLSDLDMPRLSGFELATAASAIRANLPVILMSGLPLEDTALEKFASAGWRYFQKPFALPEILTAIDAALTRSSILPDSSIADTVDAC